MNKQAQQRIKARIAANLNSRLFLIEMRIMQGPSGRELQGLEQNRVRIQHRLAEMYGIPQDTIK